MAICWMALNKQTIGGGLSILPYRMFAGRTIAFPAEPKAHQRSRGDALCHDPDGESTVNNFPPHPQRARRIQLASSQPGACRIPEGPNGVETPSSGQAEMVIVFADSGALRHPKALCKSTSRMLNARGG
jgi:hypothetical protein